MYPVPQCPDSQIILCRYFCRHIQSVVSQAIRYPFDVVTDADSPASQHGNLLDFRRNIGPEEFEREQYCGSSDVFCKFEHLFHRVNFPVVYFEHSCLDHLVEVYFGEWMVGACVVKADGYGLLSLCLSRIDAVDNASPKFQLAHCYVDIVVPKDGSLVFSAILASSLLNILML